QQGIKLEKCLSSHAGKLSPPRCIGYCDNQCFTFQTHGSGDLANWSANRYEPGSEHCLFPTFVGVSRVTQHLWNQHQQISEHGSPVSVRKPIPVTLPSAVFLASTLQSQSPDHSVLCGTARSRTVLP